MIIAGKNIRHITALTHDGKVLAFGTTAEGRIVYSVKRGGFEDAALRPGAEPFGFEDWKELRLGESAADASVASDDRINNSTSAGFSLLRSVYGAGAEVTTTIDAPVQAVSALGHVCVFRHAPTGKLLVSRFVLDALANELVPRLEVRYRRSGERLAPEESATAGGATFDNLDYRDIDGKSFYEPALELGCVWTPGNGWFAPVFVPTFEGDRFRWHIFFFDAAAQKLALHTIGASRSAFFDLKDHLYGTPDPADPENTLYRTIPGVVRRVFDLGGLTIVGCPSATVYDLQRERMTDQGLQLARDAMRVMLAVPVKAAGSDAVKTAVLSFALGKDGSLSMIDLSPDSSAILRSEERAVLTPLSLLDSIKEVATLAPPPAGTIVATERGEGDLLQIRTQAPVPGSLRRGARVQVSGTRSYDGHYKVLSSDGTTFVVAASFTRDEAGRFEVVPEVQTGLVFDNMIVGGERTVDGKLQIRCAAHDLKVGDELQISGTQAYDGTFPVKLIDAGKTAFTLDAPYFTGEAANLTRVVRRGLRMAAGDHLEAPALGLTPPNPEHDVGRTLSVWVRVDAAGNAEQDLLRDAGGLMALTIGADNSARLTVRMSDGQTRTIVDPQAAPTNVWVHYAGAFDYRTTTGGDTRLTLCRDGAEVAALLVRHALPCHLGDQLLAFDGVDDGVDAPTNPPSVAGKSFTVELWLRRGRAGVQEFALWQGTENALNGGLHIGFRGNDAFTFATWGNDLNTAGLYPDADWHHYACVYNHLTRTKRVYRDGALIGELVCDSHYLGSGALSIGRFASGLYPFKGNIADLRLWDRAREPDEIVADMTRRLSGREPGLLAYWPLDNGTTRDLSPAKRHGALRGGAAWGKGTYLVPQATSSGPSAALPGFMRLDGVKDHVVVPPLANPTAALTVSVWARSASPTWSAFGCLVSKRPGLLLHPWAGERKVDLTININGVDVSLSHTPADIQRWHNYTGTYDGATVRFYVDGALVGQAPASGPVLADADGALSIGHDDGYLPRERNLAGDVAGVQLWSRALTDAEIQQNLTRRLTGGEPGLVGHWPLAGGPQDVSPNLRHGKVWGAPRVWDAAAVTIGGGFTGELAEAQVWDRGRDAAEIKASMHLRLSGKEQDLAAYWRLGAVVFDPASPLVPDFSLHGADAQVYGDPYAGARRLGRATGSGLRAIQYASSELCQVAAHAMYEESLEFRVTSPDPAFDPNNADGAGRRLFTFAYWGKTSLGSKETVRFPGSSLQPGAFQAIGGGWYRATCRVIVPEGIGLMRAFELGDVRGRWGAEPSPPGNEWTALEVRRHKIRLISDAITLESYTDAATLSVAAGQPPALATGLADVARSEYKVGRGELLIADLFARLDVAQNAARYTAEKTALTSKLATLQSQRSTLQSERTNLVGDVNSYYCKLRARHSQLVLGVSAGRLVQTVEANLDAEFFSFRPKQDTGFFYIVNKALPTAVLWAAGGFAEDAPASATAWFTINVDATYLRVVNTAGNQSLMIADGSRTSGAATCTGVWSGFEYQQFARERTAELLPAIKDSVAAKDAQITALDQQIGAAQQRLDWLTLALAGGETVTALQTQLTAAQTNLTAVRGELATRSAAAMAALAPIPPVAMPLIATDDRDLTTTGAVLEFVNPQGRVHLLESAEGNVLLSHVDAQGRLRALPFDVALDSRNQTFEQWLPDGARACADLRDAADKVTLAQPLTLAASGWTCEAWVHYPLATRADGTAYPSNAVAAAEARNDAPLVVVRGNRLGVMADGWFFDAGVDLTRLMSIGWHHVAATMGPDGVAFHVDGARVGAATTMQPALRLGGAVDWVEVPAHANPTAALTVSVWARSAGPTWNRGANLVAKRDAFIMHPNQNTREVTFYAWIAGALKSVTYVMPEIQGWHLYTGTHDGTNLQLYVDGELRATLAVTGAIAADSGVMILGSDDAAISATNGPLAGDIAEVAVWSNARTVNDIRQDLYRPLRGDEAGLVGYWRMTPSTDAGVLKVKDLTANARHGLVKGAPRDIAITAQRAMDIKLLGNLAAGGSPIGRLAEVRLWSATLGADELAASARVLLTGNEPGLVGYFPLGEGAGPAITNRSAGAVTHGVATGVDWVGCTAPIGHPGTRVLNFVDRGGGSVTCAPLALSGKSFTIECWARRSGGNMTTWVALVSFGSVSAVSTNCWLGFTNVNKLFLGFNSNDLDSSAVVTDNDWHHFCGTYDQPTKKQRVYLDGALVGERTAPTDFIGTADMFLGKAAAPNSSFSGNLAEVRIWDRARTEAEIRAGMRQRATGGEAGLLACYPLDEVTSDGKLRERRSGQLQGQLQGSAAVVLTTQFAAIGVDSVVAAEYSAIDVGPDGKKQALMRRALAYAVGGSAQVSAEQRVEEMTLQWIGNTQISPTLLGYIEGAPPVPSENMTQEEDYDGATVITLTQSEETSFSWQRSEATSQAFSMDGFAGVGWEIEGGLGIVTKVAEGKVGVTGAYETEDTRANETAITATSTLTTSDRLALTGIPEKEETFPALGTRWVPKNVGYALVISGMADVFVTKLKRSGRMVSYDIRPVEGVPLDVNTITFLINPSYTLNGSLDGLVGSRPADDVFYPHVPAMRAQYGSLYPASYFRLKEAYALKEAIERQDKARESFFYNTRADQFSAPVDPGAGQAAGGSGDAHKQEAQDEAGRRQTQISGKHADMKNKVRASAAFTDWQTRMEGIQTRAGKRNIVNTYVWDADGGLRAEQQSFASTIEHSISAESREAGGLGLSIETMTAAVCLDMSLMVSSATTSATSRRLGTAKSLQLDVDLSGVETDMITDLSDNPRVSGEKVDRYRFMTFYLEGSTDHFHDFFNQVVDPVWLQSNDEEARALRQTRAAKPNKCWRVLHRVTYVERPVLLKGVSLEARALNTLAVTTPNPLARQAELVARIDGLEAKLDEILSKLVQT